MSLFPLSRAADWLSARLVGDDDPAIVSVSTDTRSLQSGALFVALTGPNFDGHEFAAQAAQKGAAALLVSRQLDIDLPQLLVEDTRSAFGGLAAAWRRTLPGKVVGITGSNGKTTTKEMVLAALAGAGSVAATKGNLNNDIGVPLTLLDFADQDYLVLEMGANHSGEIAGLSAIGRPDVAIITNAGRAHLEGFGSLEGVARAKGEIIQGLPADGVFVLNADDAFADLWRELAAGKRLLSFGEANHADVRIVGVEQPLYLNGSGFRSAYRIATPRGELILSLALPGRHNLMNALAAVAVAEALGVDHESIRSGLAALRPVKGRLAPLFGPAGCRLIDDSYNANPDSVRAALDVLKQLSGRRWLVLGDLAELGEEAEQLHEEVGREARQAGLDRLWAVGRLSSAAVSGFGAGARLFDSCDSLTHALTDELVSDDLVLVKGSRSAAMDRVVDVLSTAGEG